MECDPLCVALLAATVGRVGRRLPLSVVSAEMRLAFRRMRIIATRPYLGATNCALEGDDGLRPCSSAPPLSMLSFICARFIYRGKMMADGAAAGCPYAQQRNAVTIEQTRCRGVDVGGSPITQPFRAACVGCGAPVADTAACIVRLSLRNGGRQRIG